MQNLICCSFLQSLVGCLFAPALAGEASKMALSQDDPGQRTIYASLRQKDLLGYAYQPGGTPLARDLWPGHKTSASIYVKLSFHVKDL